MAVIVNGSVGTTREFPPKSKVNIYCITTRNSSDEVKESLINKMNEIATMLSVAGYDDRPDRSYHFFDNFVNKAPLKRKLLWLLRDIVQHEADNYSGEIKSIANMERFFEYAGKILTESPVIYVSDIRTKTESERVTTTYSPNIPNSLWISPIGAHHEISKNELEKSLYSFMQDLEKK